MAQRLTRTRRRLVKRSRIFRNKDRFLSTVRRLWNGTAFESWARTLDPALWSETLDVARQIECDMARIIPGLPISSGSRGLPMVEDAMSESCISWHAE